MRVIPGLEVEYSFLSSPGDRELDTPLPELLRKGGFTGDLGVALRADAIDIAVHLWKDLPFATNPATHIAATLPRADARDLLLVKRHWLAGTRAPSCACCPRPRAGAPTCPDSCSGRCPSNRRASPSCWHAATAKRASRQLMEGEAAALVVAKANIDRLLESTAPEFAAVRERVRDVLDACEIMVLPLALNPTAPGQGALALEIRRDRADLAALLAPVNDEATFGRVIAERARLSPTGDEDHPLGVSIVPLHCGEIEFTRGQKGGQWIQSADACAATIHRCRPRAANSPCGPATRAAPTAIAASRCRCATTSSPTPASASSWPGPKPGPMATPRAPGRWSGAPGIDTWRRLAARGIWVHGSDESLGEGGAAALKTLFPRVQRWVKFSHEQGYRLAVQRAEWPPTGWNAAPRWPI